tara:strand:+ start:1051 stop:1416 length:366 start_codon:yes stop_codon:yes gene_type:complete
MTDKKNFRPKCMVSNTHIAVNNRNQLLPCCYWDINPRKKLDQVEHDLMAKSHIGNFDTIADILKQKVWVDFYKSLEHAEKTQDITNVTQMCRKMCVDGGEAKFRKEEWFDNSGKKIADIGK